MQQIKIVSYNILSPELARSNYYVHSNPKYLKSSYRLNLCLSQIDDIINESNIQTIICIQELSRSWLSDFLLWFYKRNYTLIYSLHG